MEENKGCCMNVKKETKQEFVFVRKFRWTFEGTNLSTVFMKKVAFDFIAKKIDFSHYEISGECQLIKWLNSDLSNEKMTFLTYDGCGKEIYKIIFSGIKLLADKASFDYNDSGESIRDITVGFNSLERIENE